MRCARIYAERITTPALCIQGVIITVKRRDYATQLAYRHVGTKAEKDSVQIHIGTRTSAHPNRGVNAYRARELIPHLTSSTCCCNCTPISSPHLASAPKRGREICTCEYLDSILVPCRLQLSVFQPTTTAIMSTRGYIPILVAMMLLTGVCNTLLTKYQVCVA